MLNLTTNILKVTRESYCKDGEVYTIIDKQTTLV
jgi:hypothetical protein